MKIIFAGTPDFAVAPLLALAEQHDIVAVYTQPDRKAGRGKKLTPPPVKQAALERGIPVFQPSSLKDQHDEIQAMQADVMVVVAYGVLLPQRILDTPRLGCINIHASILPRWRGAAPIQRALEAGDKQTGISIMQMELGLDTGPVYQTLLLDISNNDTSHSLHDKLAALGAQGICQTLNILNDEPLTQPEPQDHAQSSYAKKITKAEAELDWRRSAAQLHQQLRAFIPWPISQTKHHTTRLRVWQASVVKQQHNVAAGTIVRVNEAGVDVACGQDTLRLEVLQRDGSKPMPYSQFRNGYTLAVDEQLGDLPR